MPDQFVFQLHCVAFGRGTVAYLDELLHQILQEMAGLVSSQAVPSVDFCFVHLLARSWELWIRPLEVNWLAEVDLWSHAVQDFVPGSAASWNPVFRSLQHWTGDKLIGFTHICFDMVLKACRFLLGPSSRQHSDLGSPHSSPGLALLPDMQACLSCMACWAVQSEGVMRTGWAVGSPLYNTRC